MVDFFLLIQLAGTGDELQGIKRGIMEMADGIIINKADGDNIDKANLAAAQFRNALHLFPPSESGWFPKVLTYSGYYNLGIKEIWDMVGEYMEFTKKNGYFDYKRNEQAKYWMYESINDTLRDKFYHNPAVEGMLEQTEKQVLNNEISSFVAAKRMIDLSWIISLRNRYKNIRVSHDLIMLHSFLLEPYIDSFVFFRFHGQTHALVSLPLLSMNSGDIVGFHKNEK